jgi:hypothetical protein
MLAINEENKKTLYNLDNNKHEAIAFGTKLQVESKPSS